MTNALASYIENHTLMGFIPFVSEISLVKVDFSELDRKQMVVKALLWLHSLPELHFHVSILESSV